MPCDAPCKASITTLNNIAERNARQQGVISANTTITRSKKTKSS